jgi:hypothetical protein
MSALTACSGEGGVTSPWGNDVGIFFSIIACSARRDSIGAGPWVLSAFSGAGSGFEGVSEPQLERKTVNKMLINRTKEKLL